MDLQLSLYMQLLYQENKKVIQGCLGKLAILKQWQIITSVLLT